MSIAFIDYETTGLLVQGSNDFMVQPGIVQIGAIRLDDKGKEVARLDQIINPEMKIGEQASKVHGLYEEHVQDAPTFFEFFPTFADFVLGARSWGGYNNPFDQGVLWFQLIRYGFERRFPWPMEDIDVMKLVSRHLGTVPGKGHDRWKLGNAHLEILGKPLEGAHGAIEDIEGTVNVWRKIK